MSGAISLGLTRPGAGAWWPQGARYAADFINGRYMREGTPITQADALTLTRASGKWAPDRDGIWHYFEPNELARTNAGALIEPAGTNLIPNPGLAGAVVGILGAGGSLPTGWYVNNTLTTEVLEITTLMGLPALRIRVSGIASGVFYELNMCPASTPIAASVRYAGSVFLSMESGIAPEIQLRQANSSDGLLGVNVLTSAESRHKVAFTSFAAASRTRLRLTYTLVADQNFSSEIVFSCPQLEAGYTASSPLLNDRLQDTGFWHLGAAGGQFRVTYFDGTSATNLVGSSNEAIVPGAASQVEALHLT